MKKKLVLFLAILSAMLCLLAITVMATEIPEWTDITEVSGMPDKSTFGDDGTIGATSRVLMSDGKTYPAYYICKNQTTIGISFSDLNSKTGESYKAENVVRIELPKGTITVSDALKVANGYTALLTVDIPEGVTKIDQYGFKTPNITTDSPIISITLPSTLNTIGLQAFYGCNSLKELIIPEGVTAIPKEMAYYATAIETLELPSTIESIGESAFRSAGLLNGVVIPEGCTEISNYAFKACNATYVELPSTLETVGDQAFTESKALTTLYSKAPMIGVSMFKDCFNLEFVTLENTKVIKSRAFNMESPNIAKISKLALPEGLTTIGEYAFVRLSITELVTPSTLTTVEKHAFAYCKNLKKVVVLGPTIGANMFADGGNKLEEFVFTNKLTSMGSGAFNNVRADSFITYYTGNNEEAESFKASFQGITTRFKDASYCSYEDYISGNYTAKNYMFVYDCNICEVAFDNNHTEPQDDGDCTTALVCSMCADYTYREAKAHIENKKVTYISFLQEGEYYVGCTNEGCTHGTTEKLNALFTCQGYSAPENGNGGIAIGFTVNNVAVKKYEDITGNKLSYGVFVVAQSKLGNSNIFDENGKAISSAITAELTSYSLAIFEIKVAGFTTNDQKNAKLAMGAYVKVTDGKATEYSYLQPGTPNANEKYCFASYNEVVADKKEA